VKKKLTLVQRCLRCRTVEGAKRLLPLIEEALKNNPDDFELATVAEKIVMMIGDDVTSK
jgi:hypothetical protein